MSSAPPPGRKLPLVKILLAVIVLLVVAVVAIGSGSPEEFALRARSWVESVMGRLRDAGPTVFFLMMAVVPVVGFPISIFSLTAGPTFGATLGMGPVLLWASLAVISNVVVSYFLARRVLRPPLQYLIRRLGYQMPEVEKGDATDVILLLRATPGVPFFVQNYLLGLAEVPFGRFLLISCLISVPYNAGFVLFGDALLHGKGKIMLVAVGLLVTLAATLHLLRRHYQAKKRKLVSSP